MDDLDELQDVEDAARIRVLTWMGIEGDRTSDMHIEMARDADAYREAVERRVLWEDEAKRAGLVAAHPWMGDATQTA